MESKMIFSFFKKIEVKFTTGLCSSEHHDCGIKVEAERTSWVVKWRFTVSKTSLKSYLEVIYPHDYFSEEDGLLRQLSPLQILHHNFDPLSSFFNSQFCNSHGFIINGLS